MSVVWYIIFSYAFWIVFFALCNLYERKYLKDMGRDDY
mgnify:CR=1 FL=1